MNDILMEIFPEAVCNLIIRFNIHPVAEAFKHRIKIDEEEIQAVINLYKCSFSFAYFQNLAIEKQLEYDRGNYHTW